MIKNCGFSIYITSNFQISSLCRTHKTFDRIVFSEGQLSRVLPHSGSNLPTLFSTKSSKHCMWRIWLTVAALEWVYGRDAEGGAIPTDCDPKLGMACAANRQMVIPETVFLKIFWLDGCLKKRRVGCGRRCV